MVNNELKAPFIIIDFYQRFINLNALRSNVGALNLLLRRRNILTIRRSSGWSGDRRRESAVMNESAHASCWDGKASIRRRLRAAGRAARVLVIAVCLAVLPVDLRITAGFGTVAFGESAAIAQGRGNGGNRGNGNRSRDERSAAPDRDDDRGGGNDRDDRDDDRGGGNDRDDRTTAMIGTIAAVGTIVAAGTIGTGRVRAVRTVAGRKTAARRRVAATPARSTAV